MFGMTTSAVTVPFTAPVSPMVIVRGKVLGGTALAFGQGLILLLLAPLVGFKFTPLSFGLALVVMFVVSFGLTALGFCIAWRMSSTQGFHAVMMLVLMPMWLLSGAFFPLEGGPAWLTFLMKANPLTYGVALVRHALWEAPTEFAPSMALVGLDNVSTTVSVASTRKSSRTGIAIDFACSPVAKVRAVPDRR